MISIFTQVEQAVIIAGGLGTRLSSISQDKPKILMSIGNTTILDIQLEQIAKSGFKKVTFLLGNGANHIIQTLEKKKKVNNFSLEIDWIVESKILGTGGSIVHALDRLDPIFLVLYGDLVINLDFAELAQKFQESSATFACLVHPTNHMFDSDILQVDRNYKIKSVRFKGTKFSFPIRNLANTGVYFFTKKAFKDFHGKKLDLDQDIIPTLINRGETGVALRHNGFIKDVGTVARIEEVNKKLSMAKYLDRPRPVLFLDRDGVINRHVGNITKSTQIYVFPAISALIKRFNEAGYLVLVVTNQPVLSRGELTSDGLDQIHASIDEQLTEHGAYIDDYFICPHHPDDGFLGEISELKIVCECRKPKIGLISQSLMKYNLDFEHAIMLGDTWRDEELAAKIGVTYYSVDRNASSEDEIDALIEKIYPYEQWWKKYSLTN